MEESVCKIANSEAKMMEFKNGNCIASFNNMQLSNLRRNDRGNKEELVTEQKYGVIFYMDVQVLGKLYTVKVSLFVNRPENLFSHDWLNTTVT